MTDQVQGTVAPGFERVHEEFRRNLVHPLGVILLANSTELDGGGKRM
jgi:hypothetical protein